jgi:hypothetical protein
LEVFALPAYRAIPRVRDLRRAPAANDADVTVEPASSTTNDQPELTDARVAPEASPAKTKKRRSKKAKS